MKNEVYKICSEKVLELMREMGLVSIRTVTGIGSGIHAAWAYCSECGQRPKKTVAEVHEKW
jgi:hypothetical protein